MAFLIGEPLPETHFCKRCKTTHPISEFKQKNMSDGKRIYLTCKLVKSGGKKKLNAISHTDEYKKNSKLLLRYGITLEEYNKIFEIQNGCCTICGIHQNQLTRNLAVDHNHKTGTVRGLLCTKCNIGIGKLQESVEILKKSIEYIIKPPLKSNLHLIQGYSNKKDIPKHNINTSTKRRSLWVNYKISLEDFDRIYNFQNKTCAICNKSDTYISAKTSLPKTLSVDHCHETNEVRGLLCDVCNTGLGLLQHSPTILQKAIHYLNN